MRLSFTIVKGQISQNPREIQSLMSHHKRKPLEEEITIQILSLHQIKSIRCHLELLDHMMLVHQLQSTAVVPISNLR